MKKSFAVLSVVAVAVSLTACAPSADPGTAAPSATEAATPSSTPTPGKGNIASDGTDFTTIKEGDLKLDFKDELTFLSSAGTKGTISFIDKSDKRVKEIEEYRKDTHGYDVSYMHVEVDNRDGSEAANMFGVNLYDPEGMKYEYIKLHDILDEWDPLTDYDTDTYTLIDGTELSSEEWYELSSRGVDLSNSLKWAVDPDEKSSFILATRLAEKYLPKEIESVSVLAHGAFDEVPAKDPLVGEYREWMAAQEAGVEWEAYDASTAEPVPSE